MSSSGVILRQFRLAFMLPLLLSGVGATALGAKPPCRAEDLKRPQLPAMVEIDLELLHGLEGQDALPEWSKIEKLRGFYWAHSEASAPCLQVEGGDVGVQMFAARRSEEAEAAPEAEADFRNANPLQFYGASRVKVERADQQVTREYAYPLDGPVPISEVVKDPEREVLMEDLAQIRMVRVPRIKRRDALGGGGDCFLVSYVTLVPTRVFDESDTWPDSSESSPLTLDARRRALENVTQAVEWLRRIETELPGCTAADGEGYRARQITSLNLTVKELVPDLDFVTQAIRFWRVVEARVQQLRDEEQSWRKEIGLHRLPAAPQLPERAF